MSRSVAAVKAARDRLWLQVPPIGRAEVAVRSRKLERRLWDFAYLRSLPPQQGRALDIGANIGLYTAQLSSKFSWVDAFEPNPRLRERLSVASAANVTTWPCALSRTSGQGTLVVPVQAGRELSGLGALDRNRRSGPGRPGRYPVRLVTLDAFAFDDVRMVKIDVEGHELDVLEGGCELFAGSGALTVLVEAEERHRTGSPDAVRRFFGNLGFAGWFVHGYEVYPVEQFDAARHQRDPSDAARYSNMFIYTNRDPESTVHHIADVVDSM